jgi:hypothetical protein
MLYPCQPTLSAALVEAVVGIAMLFLLVLALELLTWIFLPA